MNQLTPEKKAEVIDAILRDVSEGLPEYQAAKNAGISWATFWNWKEYDPTIYARVEEAKRGRVSLVEDALYKAALKGNVTACLTILRKESKQWREMLDGSLAPAPDPSRIASAAAAGAVSVLQMLSSDKREKLKAIMRKDGMIIDVNPAHPNQIGHNGKNGNGTNGNGNGVH